MDNKKIKILINNEFSELSTGFSTYMKHILPYLHSTGKYEIAEFARYIDSRHPLIDNVPWKVYTNLPENSQEKQIYDSDPTNQFGKYKFNSVILDFKPDIVIAVDDPWMAGPYISASPYRRMFKHIQLVTCDGEPQKVEWLDAYKKYDKILTYTLWAKNLIEKQSCGKIKIDAVATAGVDTDTFKPIDKNKVREQLGFKSNMFIINTVMRNQPRKLFPYLFDAFAKFLQLCKDNNRKDIAENTYLYCHTSYPDVGWDLASELQRYQIGHKVIFTYMCDACGFFYPSFFSGDVCKCKRCGNQTCHMPNTSNGLSKDQLAKVMGIADLYIQYSCSEGLGMPINDAKSCGVPIMAVEYSGMTEQCYNGGGIPIKVKNLFRESLAGTYQFRAEPDNQDCAQKIFEFFTQSQEYRDALGKEAYNCVQSHYTKEHIAKIWESVIDSTECPDQSETWFSKPRIVKPNISIPNGLTNQQFIEYCYRTILGEQVCYTDQLFTKACASLDLGYEIVPTPNGIEKRPVDRNVILSFFLRQIQEKNSAEELRYKLLNRDSSKNLSYVEM